MPWDQIVTAAAVVVLGIGGWRYAWRPERSEPPHAAHPGGAPFQPRAGE